jgi:hypothetical protein
MDAGTQEFIHCLVASADYDSFYSVMVREGLKLDQLDAMHQLGSSADLKVGPPATAEAKGGAAERSGSGGKGGDDDDDDDDKGYK